MNIVSIIKGNAKLFQRYIYKESPTILTSLGVTGVVATVVLAVKGTPKALYLIDRANHLKNGEELTKLEIVKLTWKCYIPAGISGITTIACIIGANSINLRRNAALVSLYTLTEASLREYQDKVVELIGKNKEAKVRDEIAQDRLNNDSVTSKQVIITGKGETLFYDSLTGRYFKSDMEAIRKLENDFNKELLGDMYIPLNDWYDMLGLEPTEMGRTTGWDVENGLMEIMFSAKIATSGQPCIVIDYKHGPKNL